LTDARSSTPATIAVVGGTGELGGALARRWVKAGLTVLIGSRDADNARTAAAALGEALGKSVGFGANPDVAARADIVVLAVPWSAQEATLLSLKDVVEGKIVVDTTVPLVPPKVMRVQLPSEGAAALRAQNILGEGVRVVSGFHNVSAQKLARDEPFESDVLIFGDERGAREVVVGLAEAAGLRGVHGGALANSAAAEALTSVLIFVNKMYRVEGGAGIRLTGVLNPPGA